jgi:hypothetical protein
MPSGLLTLHTKAFLPIQSIDALPVHDPALSTKLYPDPLVAPAHANLRDLANTHAK